ncbi:MAG TPA: aminopeptidase [Chloroflexia bacterium]|nr:aminopeptidase [Chloroflexia bacterium]
MNSHYNAIARRILRVSAGVQPGERVTILGRADSLDFCEALELECRRLQALPFIVVGSDAALLAALTDPEISDEALAAASPQLLAALAASDLVITTYFERATPHLFSGIAPSRLHAHRRSEEAPSDIIFDGKRRWIGTEVPTPGHADMLGCDWPVFHQLFWEAMAVDYAEVGDIARLLSRRLQNCRTLRLKDAAGRTDLWLSSGVGGRPVERDDGIIGPDDLAEGALYLNLPSGEVCFAPPEQSVSGQAYVETAYWQGQPVRGLVLNFADGRVQAQSAEEGFELFNRVLANAGGDAFQIGEFGIGLNPAVNRVTGFTLLDEKIIGTCHIALGENRALGGINNSALHWDLVVQDAILEADGEVLLAGGKFFL